MKWFARGKLWDSPEQAQWAGRHAHNLRRTGPPRDRDWRPGGAHKDPRARFDKHKKKHRPHGDRSRETDRDRPPVQAKPDVAPPRSHTPAGAPPWREKPEFPPRADRPWQNKSGSPRADRPWRDPSTRPPSFPPRSGQGPSAGSAQGKRPRDNKPAGGPPRGDRPWAGKPPASAEPRRDKPGPLRGDRPWSGKPARPKPPGRRPFPPKRGGGR